MFNHYFLFILIINCFCKLQTNQTDFIFCNDICSSFPWLNDLKYSKNMPALGIMFCCDPQEVGQKYELFQQILNSLNYEKEGKSNRINKIHIEEPSPVRTTIKSISYDEYLRYKGETMKIVNSLEITAKTFMIHIYDRILAVFTVIHFIKNISTLSDECMEKK